MLMQSKFFNLIIMASTVVCGHSNDKSNQPIKPQCVDWGESCDLKNRITCCNKDLICTLAVSNHSFICAKEAELGGYCKFNEDCAAVWHAKCSWDNQCICMPNHIKKNYKTCAPLLGEYCVLMDQCGTENSVCIDHKCQCKKGYFANSINECLPKTIGEKCDSDENCSDIKFSKCSLKKKVCTCVTNTVALNSALCYPLLNVFCRGDHECMVDHSICLNNICSCKPKHIDANNKCIPMYLNMPCEDNLDCRMNINNTMCSSDNKCICDYSYFQSIDGVCLSEREKSCYNDELCYDENAVCVNYKCKCKPEYIAQGSKCLLSDVGSLESSCSSDFECRGVQNAICLNSKRECTCKKNYVKIDRKCVPRLGGLCQTNDECYIENSICIDNHCQCKFDYLNVLNKKCVLLDSPKRSCYNNDPDCLLVTTAECSENRPCFCEDYQLKINSSECTAFSGDFCAPNVKCGSQSSICVRNQCTCKFEYVSHFRTNCSAPFLGMPCEYDSYCQKFINNTVCLRHTCICDNKFSPLNNTKCLPKLNAPCSGNELCAPKNSICIDNICKCETNYVRKRSECIEPNVLEDHSNDCSLRANCSKDTSNTSVSQVKYCSIDQDCWSYVNSKCSLTNTCVCKENNFASKDNYCYPVLNGFCKNNEHCGANFHCVNFKCQCKPNFLPISVNQCVPTGRLYLCNDNTDCSDPWHSKCSENKCICNENNIAFNNTCLPILDGYCWRDDQCIVENSICINYRCRCKPDFIALANNLCIS